ncbi:MAG TPA: ABC transporter permease [Vicinamibacterales bacterium]|nr:ABC transporter permease [Vicinamibacterales bacterium]
MDALWQDIRLAVRTYLKQPGFTAVAVLILALGIGANTAIYTLVDAVALRPLPVTRPSELVRLGDTNACCVNTGLQKDTSLFSYPSYLDFREHTPEFVSLAAFQANTGPFSVRRTGSTAPAVPLGAEFVSANYFTTLGVAMAAGRGLVDDDDRPGAAPAAVLSYRAWRDQYGLDSGVVGGTFTMSGVPVTIVGVTAEAFFGETLRANPPSLFLPLGIEPVLRGNGQGVASASGAATSLLARTDQNWLYIVGRLKPGVSREMVQEKVSAELRDWLSAQSFLSDTDRKQLSEQHIVVTSAATGVSTLRTRYADALRVLAVVSALVLLIACANLANLLLARAQPFQFAMRAALGASRPRLIREMLTSGLVLAAAGGAAGILVAYLGARVIVATAFRGATFIPIDTAPSPAILGFAMVMTLFAAAIFTTMPAWIMSKTNPMDALRGSGRSTADRAALPRQGLVILQVAVSLVLIIGAGLLTRSLLALQNQDFGFETDGRLAVRVDPSVAGYTAERLPALYERLPSELSKIPGVVSVTLSQYSPMEGNNWSGPFSLEGRAVDPDHRISSSWLRVGPRYFETIGAQIVRGRAIDERDTATSLHVAVVNQAFADAFFPNEDPIGKHLGQGEEPGRAMDYEIVGIVENTKYVLAEEPAFRTYFIPLLQTVPFKYEGNISMQARSMFIRDIVLHVSGGPDRLKSVQADVRRSLAAIDPNLTVNAVLTFGEQLALNFNQQRLVATLTSLYGQLALLLAAIGLYGITAHNVARRTGEIGIRMALGADRRRVLVMVLKRALIQTSIGLAIGLPIALFAGRGLSTQLYGITPRDPLVIGTAIGVLLVAALIAGVLPARRAASIDPIRALKTE